MLHRFQVLREFVFPVGIIACIFVILVPLPATVMDLLVAMNFAISAMILLTAIQVRAPVEFNVFPVVLVSTVIFRLVLNLASTRMILTRADSEGLSAAGNVIRAFGEFVSGDRLEVGLILFAIIFVIQFVVITKGATRISEVAARFTLDGLPGRQTAIDADLNAGLIDRQEASNRREKLALQTDFFGAMDGAGKYVRGDAVAGVVITLINLIAGLYIGLVHARMGVVEATTVFSKLTIGDGLVSQIPSFLISMAAAILITRTSQKSDLSLDIMNQLFARPKVLWIAGGFLLLLIFTNLPAIPMLAIGGSLIAFGALGKRLGLSGTGGEQQRSDVGSLSPKVKAQDGSIIEELFSVEPIELAISSSLRPLVDGGPNSPLLERLTELRKRFVEDLGILIPAIKITDRMGLAANRYQIRLRGELIAAAELDPTRWFAADCGKATGEIEGISSLHPADGASGKWIDADHRAQAIVYGYRVQDGTTVLVEHLSNALRTSAHELITRDATKQLLDQLRKVAPAIVEDAVPSRCSLGELQKILRKLVREEIPVRNLQQILEALTDHPDANSSIIDRTEYVRKALSRTITHRFRDSSGRLVAINIDPDLEDEVIAHCRFDGDQFETNFSEPALERIRSILRAQLKSFRGLDHRAIFVVTSRGRPYFQAITSKLQLDVIILSNSEIESGTAIVSPSNFAQPALLAS